jgi:hypothetical protein
VARPPRRRRTYRVTGFTAAGFGAAGAIRLAILVVVIAGIAVPLISVGNAVHSISVPSFNFNPGSGPANGPSAPKQVSYLRPAGLRAGLARIERLEPGARLSLLRIDANSLSAGAVLPNRTVKEIYFGPTVTSITSGAVSGERAIPISQIKPNAVARIVSEMDRRFHVAPNRIDYMVISSPPGVPARWIVFSKAPSHPGFSATLGGANLLRLGG